MQIPSSPRSKALVVVDVQPSFLNARNKNVVQNILKLLSTTKYDLYIEATFHAEKASLWDIQQKWVCPKGEKTQTIEDISKKLGNFGALRVEKETKSVFKGDKNVASILREKNITEVHVVGLDTNDCVLATAYESFDLGFITYVIEECCQSSSSEELHKHAIEILRGQNMTNNSVVEKIDFQNIE